MNRVVHFEIHADDIQRAIKFYGGIFGWEFPKYLEEPTPYWGIVTAPETSKEKGINGGLLLRKGGKPVDGQCVNSYVCTIQVEDFDKIAEKILAAGGTIALPKQAIAGMAWQGYFKDTEGNIFGVHQADVNAK